MRVSVEIGDREERLSTWVRKIHESPQHRYQWIECMEDHHGHEVLPLLQNLVLVRLGADTSFFPRRNWPRVSNGTVILSNPPPGRFHWNFIAEALWVHAIDHNLDVVVLLEPGHPELTEIRANIERYSPTVSLH